MHGVLGAPAAGPLAPNHLQRLHLVRALLAALAGRDAEHRGAVEHEGELVARVGEHAELGDFRLEPSPGGLRPDHDVVVRVARREELVEEGAGELGDVFGGALAVEERIVEVENQQPANEK
eukprot:CAMPEP_0174887606 /NCGR_PEP_ID=MMETSP0167-20121228/2850_1 /TAXON_ID=38298 /ORGANISM="Rhodella maculata, Strain CCMP736" /LENGTH=120 /DNA_ID=CAMNT_0016124155 /DNA_START=630 /DNA_END=992 /DNA_ORIENTATION=+